MFLRFRILFSVLMISGLVLALINLNTGFLPLQIRDFFFETEHSDIAEIRVNRVLIMILAGISIPSSGFLMQEYFQNPLAGPDILGITSVASLMVAFYLFFSQSIILPEFLQNSFMSLAAIFGSMALMFLLLAVSRKFSDPSYLIIFGFLVSALAGAVVSVLQLYAENQSLKNYMLWSFGANNTATRNQIYILAILVGFSILLCFKTIKPLIGNSLGTAYAQSFGVNINRLKTLVVVSSTLFSASVTAYIGPVLFIGIIVPHFSRMLYNPAKLWHQWILNMILGIIIMLIFSVLAEMAHIPINVITSVFGIPVIVLMLLKQK